MLIEAGINPAGMIAFFEVLRRGDRTSPTVLKYLSTHPETKDRIERLKSLAAQAPVEAVKLLPDYDWRDIRKICQATRPRR